MGDVLDGEEEAYGEGEEVLSWLGVIHILCKQPALPPPISLPSAMGGGK